MLFRRLFSVFILATLVVSFAFPFPSKADPLLANYFLTNLPTDQDGIAKLSRFKVLIIQPWEALANRSVITAIKNRNPSIILLAYVPTKSYDTHWQNYPASLVYSGLTIRDEWWLKDQNGTITSDWPGHKNTNLAPEYSSYLVNHLKGKVFSQGIFDGIFWDVVYDSISFQNGGNLDINNDGIKDDRVSIDVEWTRRMQYLLDTSRRELGVKYIVFNGTSIPALQSYVNGRMYENFPTPWEGGGNWGALMAKLQTNKNTNQRPQLYIFNANTNNTGNQGNLSAMRFGLGSSLLTDNVYFSYDYGTNDHAQTWYFDEYDAKLGSPAGEAVSLSGTTQFRDDVWRRDFEHGLVLVNATNQTQHVDLGGEYETFSSTQNTSVHDGRVTDDIDLPARDSAILFKTFKTLTGAVFTNGSFARFYTDKGSRARNGFFLFEDAFPGGAKIFNGDLNGDGSAEKIVVTRGKLEIFTANGERWYGDYPFGANLKGVLNVAVGRLGKNRDLSLVVSPSTGSGKIMVFNYHGALVKDEIYPLGKKYTGGFSVAISSSASGGQIVAGVGKNTVTEVLFVDPNTSKITKRFFPYDKKYKGGTNVATGDFNGDGATEIVTVSLSDKKPVIRIFNLVGKRLAEFQVRGLFGPQQVSLAAADVNFEGKMEVVAMSGN